MVGSGFHSENEELYKDDISFSTEVLFRVLSMFTPFLALVLRYDMRSSSSLITFSAGKRCFMFSSQGGILKREERTTTLSSSYFSLDNRVDTIPGER